jgi:hypothetical protein
VAYYEEKRVGRLTLQDYADHTYRGRREESLRAPSGYAARRLAPRRPQVRPLAPPLHRAAEGADGEWGKDLQLGCHLSVGSVFWFSVISSAIARSQWWMLL